jgi:hypothetical protein
MSFMDKITLAIESVVGLKSLVHAKNADEAAEEEKKQKQLKRARQQQRPK